jgi:hypothetical protein
MTLHWLFHNYQRSLLETLYENPLESFCLSELARRSGVDPGNAKRYVQKFADYGLVKLSKEGRKTIIAPNIANPETRKIFELFELTRTKRFLEEIGGRRTAVDEFVSCLINELPDVRMITLYDIDQALNSDNVVVKMAVVVGSLHNRAFVHNKVQTLVDAAQLIHKFDVCVYTTDNIASSWNKDECGCIGFDPDRVVLFGEGYFWRMVEQQLNPVQTGDPMEEMAQNA